MMHEFIYRFHNRDKISCAVSLFEEPHEILGVIVFQEDLIKIARYFV